MYIERVPNRGSKPAVLLRESLRVGGKVVKRTIANLSALPDESVEVLRLSLKGVSLCEATRPCRRSSAFAAKRTTKPIPDAELGEMIGKRIGRRKNSLPFL